MSVRAYQFGGWLVEPELNRISSGDVERHLEPLSMDILCYLLENAGRTVSIEDLLASVWCGRVVESNAVPRAINLLRRALEDDPRDPRYIETIRKRGYRAIATIEKVAAVADSARKPQFLRTRLGSLSLVAIVGIVVLILGAFMWTRDRDPARDSLAIVVSPFRPFTEDKRLLQIAESVNEQVVHHLAKAPASWRIQVADNMEPARVVVEGTTRAAETNVELTIRITRLRPKSILWTKKVLGPNDPLDGRWSTHAEYLAQMIGVGTFVDAISEAETDSPEARAVHVRGLLEWQDAAQGIGGDPAASLAFFERASELDPQFAFPLQQLGIHYKNRLSFRLRHRDAIQRAHEYARRLLELKPDSTFLLATINASLDLDYSAALANFDHARRQGWPLGEIESEIGIVKLSQGKLREAIRHLRTAERVGAGTNRAIVHYWLAKAYFASGNLREALSASEQAIVASEGAAIAYLVSLRDHAVIARYAGEIEASQQSLDAAWERYGADRPELFPGIMAFLGHENRARQLLDLSSESFERGELPYASESFWGHFYLSEWEEAYVWLQRAIENREFWLLPMLRRSEVLGEFRQDQRFQRAMAALQEIESAGTPTASVAYSPSVIATASVP